MVFMIDFFFEKAIMIDFFETIMNEYQSKFINIIYFIIINQKNI